MDGFLPILIALIVAATVVAIVAKRANVPYNVALVVGGLFIAVSGVLPVVPQLDPAVVFLICLPVLLFEGGISSNLQGIRANALPIGTLASVGMALAIGVTGVALHWALGIDWGPAFLLATILAGTDTVSTLYAFRRVPAPPRLSGIMEGETLFNDGVTLVAYAALLGLIAGTVPLSIPGVGMEMLLAIVGGAAAGLAVGLAAAFLLRRTEDPLTEIMATTALAYGAYTLGNQMGVSGAISAVAAGLVVGATMRTAIAPQSRIAISSFWDYAAFGINTFLFLLVGLSTRPESLLGHGWEILAAYGAVFGGRIAAIYLPFLALRGWRREAWVPLRWQHVFVFGNIKGALSIALALGLPLATPNRDLLIDVAFGVTFLSLVVQGTLLIRVIRGLGLAQEDVGALAIADQQGRLIAARAARQELEQLHAAGLVPRQSYDLLRSDYQVAISSAERRLRELHDRHLALGARLLLTTRRRLVVAERNAVSAAARSGLVSSTSAERILGEIDGRMLALERVLAGEAALEEAPPGAGGPGEER